MVDTLVTALQLVGLGFTFGLAGPCLASCLPLTLSLAAADADRPGRLLRNQCLFLAGRWAAYAGLGAVAGLSAGLLQRYGVLAERPGGIRLLLGLCTILFGLFVAWSGVRRPGAGLTACRRHLAWRSGNCLLLGLGVGLAPCGPLLALLLEVALISSGPLSGLLYAGLFGAGTTGAGLVVAAASAAGARWLHRLLARPAVSRAVQAAAALALIVLGTLLVLHDLRATQP